MKTFQVLVPVQVTIRRFDESDWHVYAGSEEFLDGSPPLVCYLGDKHTVLADKNGVYLEVPGEGVQYSWNMTLSPGEAQDILELVARRALKGEPPAERIWGHDRTTAHI